MTWSCTQPAAVCSASWAVPSREPSSTTMTSYSLYSAPAPSRYARSACRVAGRRRTSSKAGTMTLSIRGTLHGGAHFGEVWSRWRASRCTAATNRGWPAGAPAAAARERGARATPGRAGAGAPERGGCHRPSPGSRSCRPHRSGRRGRAGGETRHQPLLGREPDPTRIRSGRQRRSSASSAGSPAGSARPGAVPTIRSPGNAPSRYRAVW